MNKRLILVWVMVVALVSGLLAACAAPAPAPSPAPAPVPAPAPAPPEQTWQWKFSHPMPVTSIGHFNALNLAEHINKYTDGRVTITVYPNAELFKVNEDPIGLLSGAIQCSLSYPGIIGSLASLNLIWELPMVFNVTYDDWTAWINFSEGEGGKLCNEALMEQGFIVPGQGFMAADIGNCLGNNVRPIYSVEDCAGIKMRIPAGGYAADGLEILGMSPTAMSSVEVQTALAQGVIDGALTTPIYHYDAVFKTKYLLGDVFTGTGNPFLMSILYYDSLPKDIQEAIVRAVNDCRPLAIAEVGNRSQDRIDKMANEWGQELNYLSEEEHARWIELMQPLYEDYQTVDPRAKQVYDAVVAANP